MAEETAKKEEAPKADEQVQEIQVPADVAFQLKLQKFDRNIATAEAQVYELKRQKADFVYNSNIQTITAQARAQKESAAKEEKK